MDFTKTTAMSVGAFRQFPFSLRIRQVKNIIRVMELTVLILFINCLDASASGSKIQDNITLSEKNVPLEKVIKKIRQQTDYNFFYKEDLVQQAENVTIIVTNATIAEALDICLKNRPITYTITGKTIILKEKNTILEKDAENVNSLVKIDVKGKVLNKQEQALEGVTVTVKGSNISTITDVNGEFLFREIDENSVLIFTHVNLEYREIKLNGKTDLKITLTTKITDLEDVVVINTGYQRIPRERATGSFAHVNNELLNRRVSTDILSRLEGVTPGVLFDKNPENPLGITVRGRSTLYANTQPLIVIDNFPYSGDLNSINPNDIESITVLKDAAASSVWGALSGNGVIVITTKRGKYGQSINVGLNTSLMVANKPDLFYDRNFLKSTDFLFVEKYLFEKGYYDYELANTTAGMPTSPAVEIYDQLRSGTISQAEADRQIDLLKSTDIRNDFDKYFYRRTINQQYALNVSGGGEKSHYYLSGGYNKDLSNVVGNENDRISFMSSMTFRPISKLEISGDIAYAINNNKSNGLTSVPVGGKYSTIFPYGRLADENGNHLPTVRDYRQSFVDNTGINGLLDWHYIPLDELQSSDKIFKTVETRLAVGVRYTILKGLSADIKYQFQRGNMEYRSHEGVETYYARNLINRFSVISGTDVVERAVPLGGILQMSNYTNTSNAGRGQLTYITEWNNHRISTIAGVDIREIKTTGSVNGFYGYDENTGSYSIVNHNTLYPTFPDNNTAYISSLASYSPYTLNRFRSLFGNGSYTYKNRYTFSASARIDQSNIFGVKTNQKGVPLWSVGGKWDIYKERFFDIPVLTSLTLRTTYGFNGNYDRTSTAYTTFRYEGIGGFNNVPVVGIRNVGNPQLKWEKIGMFNAGIDFNIGEGILAGSIDYFRKNGTDMIGRSTIPASTGFISTVGNYSRMKGQGFDVFLNTAIVRKAFNWTVVILMSHATDKVTKNEGDDQKLVGRPINALLSYQSAGLDDNGDPVGYLAGELSTDYGAIIDLASTNPETRMYNGSSTPQLFGSVRNILSWKGFSISAMISYKGNYYFRRSSISYATLLQSAYGHVDFSRRWQKPGDEKITNVPAFVDFDNPQFSNRDIFYRGSSVLVERGDHIRLQDVNLTFDLTKRQVSRLPFNTVQFYFYGTNLGVLWKANKEGIDPDFRTGFPNPKSFAIGLRANM
jgi:TonB-dependent starch-binding outer membrane protein SusC